MTQYAIGEIAIQKEMINWLSLLFEQRAYVWDTSSRNTLSEIIRLYTFLAASNQQRAWVPSKCLSKENDHQTTNSKPYKMFYCRIPLLIVSKHAYLPLLANTIFRKNTHHNMCSYSDWRKTLLCPDQHNPKYSLTVSLTNVTIFYWRLFIWHLENTVVDIGQKIAFHYIFPNYHHFHRGHILSIWVGFVTITFLLNPICNLIFE